MYAHKNDVNLVQKLDYLNNKLKAFESMKLKTILILCFLLFLVGLSAQQPITVSGTVTEGATGDPAIGVTVLVKGTTNGTVTGIGGDYTAV